MDGVIGFNKRGVFFKSHLQHSLSTCINKSLIPQPTSFALSNQYRCNSSVPPHVKHNTPSPWIGSVISLVFHEAPPVLARKCELLALLAVTPHHN